MTAQYYRENPNTAITITTIYMNLYKSLMAAQSNIELHRDSCQCNLSSQALQQRVEILSLQDVVLF